MNLFVLRHASAGIRRPNPLIDLKRPLDKEGKRHCLQLAHVLGNLKIQFDLVVSSPLKRSSRPPRSSAPRPATRPRSCSPTRSPPPPPCPTSRSSSATTPTSKTSSSSATTPTSPASSDRCSSPRPPAPHAQVRLRKGSLARVSLTRGPATLQWLLDPRTVRALYATSTKSSRRKTSRK